ncbi:MAG: hypothetical protein WBL39_21350, partial [Terrimicrobiaceae bacterium]
ALRQVNPARGKFRSFLAASLQNYLSDQADHSRRQKRGGSIEFVPFDPQLAECRGRPVELGRGAMGVTYKVLDVDLHCLVTLKVANRTDIEEALREAVDIAERQKSISLARRAEATYAEYGRQQAGA